MLLSEAGLPRMSARVFAYVLADDAEIYTARELSEGLRVSPAAVSGAVRQLVQAGLLAKERAPGSRVDHYRVYDDDIWSSIMAQRRPFIVRTLEVLSEGLEVIGTERPGGRRIRETIEFYRFIEEHMWAAMAEWQKHRRHAADRAFTGGSSDPGNPPHKPDTSEK
ncbi:MarR family transcriptional regulator [Phytoactinopolyspora sp. XMNu-373]|uniref:MarR family transcriptional regulator n=2 Tax=Phytoactinopolyspora mesophila TaxID=2650750 RepID=A0A7K3MDF2_9ACTN|nr:MarR family transcriptional regulator [Phytoactinopolyspora mesophila]